MKSRIHILIILGACGLSVACGKLTDNATTSTGNNNGGTTTGWNAGTTNTPPTKSNEIYRGTYSLIYGTAYGACTDGNSVSGPGGSLQIDYEVSSGSIKMAQSASSASSSQQKTASSGVTVTSSTPFSGTISNSGAFLAKSTATFYSASDGNVRLRYTLDGRFSGSSTWSGKYTMEIYFERDRLACAYESEFTGYSVN